MSIILYFAIAMNSIFMPNRIALFDFTLTSQNESYTTFRWFDSYKIGWFIQMILKILRKPLYFEIYLYEFKHKICLHLVFRKLEFSVGEIYIRSLSQSFQSTVVIHKIKICAKIILKRIVLNSKSNIWNLFRSAWRQMSISMNLSNSFLF